jgi:hypothetical protein
VGFPWKPHPIALQDPQLYWKYFPYPWTNIQSNNELVLACLTYQKKVDSNLRQDPFGAEQLYMKVAQLDPHPEDIRRILLQARASLLPFHND